MTLLPIPQTVYSVNLRRPKVGDGLAAYRLAHTTIEDRVRQLDLEEPELTQAIAHAQQRQAQLQAEGDRQARPLEDFLPEGIIDALTEQAKLTALGFVVPDGLIAQRLMHVTGVHEVLRHLRPTNSEDASSIWTALHRPDHTDEADVLGSAASYELLQRYAASEALQLPMAQSEHGPWRRAKVRRQRDVGNTGHLPQRLWPIGQWFDGNEAMPSNVIVIDPGSRSILSARSFVTSIVDGYTVVTTNKAHLTAASSRRTRKRNVRNLQAIRACTRPEEAAADHLRRIDRVASSEYAVRASRNARQQQRFDGAICRGLLSLLNRPQLRRHDGKLFIDDAEKETIIPPKKKTDVMVIIGAASSKSTAEAQGQIIKIHQCFPRWKYRWIDEHLTSQLFAEGPSIGKSPGLTLSEK